MNCNEANVLSWWQRQWCVPNGAQYLVVNCLKTGMAACLVFSLLLEGSLHAFADSDLSAESPNSFSVARMIASESEVPDGASWDDLMESGTIQKRTEPVRIYFKNGEGADFKHVTDLISAQVVPLIASIHQVVGLEFHFVQDINEADTVLIFANEPREALDAIGKARLTKWLNTQPEETDLALEPFSYSNTHCFRVLAAPGGKIVRALGFVSVDQKSEAEEHCIAKTLLYSLGLRGSSEGPSALNSDYPARQIEALDKIGLKLIYDGSVAPGMTLRDAFAIATVK